MAERTVQIGGATFRRADGPADSALWGFALMGEVVDVHDDDLGRFDALNGPSAAPVVPLPEVAPVNEPVGDEPPRAGRGSGLEAWVSYAESLGLEVDEDASRDDVISLVDNR